MIFSGLIYLSAFQESTEKLGEIVLVESMQVWEPRQIIRKGRKYQIFLFERGLILGKEMKDANGHKKFTFKNKYLVNINRINLMTCCGAK